jgi:hypothetical protein
MLGASLNYLKRNYINNFADLFFTKVYLDPDTKRLVPHPRLLFSVGDPGPHVFGPPESGTISQRYGSGTGTFSFLIKALGGLK